MQSEAVAEYTSQMTSGDSVVVVCGGENKLVAANVDAKALCMGELYANLVKNGQGKMGQHIAFCRRCGEGKVFPEDNTTNPSHDRKA